MRARVLFGVALLVMILAGAVWGAWAQGPAGDAAEAAVAQSGTYTEDFSTYDAKDFAENMDWNVWEQSLSLLPPPIDNAEQTPCGAAVDAEGNLITLWVAGPDLWAQKTSSDGNRLWQDDVLVASDALPASTWVWYRDAPPDLQLDPTGVIWVTWRNYSDIYVQKLSAAGNLLFPSAIKVTASGAGAEMAPRAAVMSAGNLFVVWFDVRNGRTDIYGQLLTSDGGRSWAADRQIASGAGAAWDNESVLAPGRDGSTVVAWHILMEHIGSENQFDAYAQRFDITGNQCWASDVRVAQRSGFFFRTLAFAVSNAGSESVYTWSLDGDYRIFAQKLNVNGEMQWAEPVLVDPGWSMLSDVSVSTTSDGSLLVGWQAAYCGDYQCSYQIQASRVSPDGVLLQGYGMGITFDNKTHSKVAAGDGGQVYIVWRDAPLDTDEVDVRAQRLDAGWESNVRINSSFDPPAQRSPALAIGDDGRLRMAWADNRSGVSGIYMQQWDAAYNRIWHVDARVDAGEAGERCRVPRIAADTDGHTWTVWEQHDGSRDYCVKIKPQRVDTNGTRTWDTDVTLGWECFFESLEYPDIVVDETHTALAVWHSWSSKSSYPSLPFAEIAATGEIDAEGNLYSIRHASISSGKLALDAAGNLVLAWKEQGNASTETRVQKWDRDWAAVWGTPVTVSAEDKGSPFSLWHSRIPGIVVDGSDDILVAWSDNRDSSDSDTAIYLQKLDTDGNVLWPADVQVNRETGPTSQGNPSIVVDAAGSVYVVWTDERGSDTRIYMQKISTTGVPQWGTDLRVDAGVGAHDPDIALDSSGDLVAAWVDMRNGNPDIYMQRISPTGVRLWTSDLQVVSPDWAYSAHGVAQSRRINSEAGHVASATLHTEHELHGGSVRYYLSNDGGGTWAQVAPGVTHTFTTTGGDLRWQVEAEPSADLLETPVLRSLRIDYVVSPAVTATPTPTRTPTSIPGVQSVTLQRGLNGYAGVTDTWIDEWYPTQNFNQGVDINFLRLYADGHQNALIRFDLSTLPAGATAASARLEFKIGSRTNANSLTADIYRLNRAWIDTQATWQLAAVGTAWEIAGAGGSSDRSQSSEGELLLNAEDGTWTSADVTALVQYWLDHPSENYGALLRARAGGGVQYALRASDHPEGDDRPKLIVQYSVPPATATPTATATATSTVSATPTPTATGTAAPADLIITGVGPIMQGYTGGCVVEYSPTVLRICVRNQGAAPAGAFGILAGGCISPSEELRLTGLGAGSDACLETSRAISGVTCNVVVDPYNEVIESDETNNTWSGPIPMLTPPPICTATPTPTSAPGNAWLPLLLK
jgi:hypothetical protein